MQEIYWDDAEKIGVIADAKQNNKSPHYLKDNYAFWKVTDDEAETKISKDCVKFRKSEVYISPNRTPEYNEEKVKENADAYKFKLKNPSSTTANNVTQTDDSSLKPVAASVPSNEILKVIVQVNYKFS